MSNLPYDEQFEELAAGYFDQVLDAAQTQQLKRLLHEDDRRVKRFAELAQLHHMIESEIAYGQRARRFNPAPTPDDSGTGSALAELASLYEDGLQGQGAMNFDTWRQEQAEKKRAEHLRLWRNRLLIGSALAALITLVAALTIQFITTHPASKNIADNTPPKPAESAPPILRDTPVATLTAGYAEITTARGAVAIVEAPATIELLDNDNAIRLHTGKLVGICETESSKGFLVRTAEMDITDLGTRFGVDASQKDKVEVHVFAGEVDIQQSDASGHENPWSQRLIAGQASRLLAETNTPRLIDARIDRFTLNDDFVAELPGTGFGVEPGEPDPRWQIVAYQGRTLDKPWQPITINFVNRNDSLPSHPRGIKWLNWYRTQRTAELTESYIFQTTIELPTSIDPATARVVIDCITDNQLAAIHVNGERREVVSKASMYQADFEAEHFEITQGLVAGENTIGFEVNNLWPEDADKNFKNGVGVYVAWRLHGRT